MRVLLPPLQTAVVTAALASHCRRAPAMGLLDQAAFLDIVAGQGKRPPPMPRAQVRATATIPVAAWGHGNRWC